MTAPQQPRLPDEELVRRIVERVLAELAPAPPAARPILVLWDGGGGEVARAEEALAQLAAIGPTRVLLGRRVAGERPSFAESHASLSIGARETAVDAARAVVLLSPHRATLGRAALGLGEDGCFGALLCRALEIGLPSFAGGGVLAGATGLPPTAPSAMQHGIGSLGMQLASWLETLGSWGLVQRRDPLELKGAIQSALSPKRPPAAAAPSPTSPAPSVVARRFLTVEDIQRTHAGGGRELRIEAGTLLTDAAREMAARLHVTLVEG